MFRIIQRWPPEDGSLYDPKHVGVKEFYMIFMCFLNKYVHDLVTIDTDIYWIIFLTYIFQESVYWMFDDKLIFSFIIRATRVVLVLFVVSFTQWPYQLLRSQ